MDSQKAIITVTFQVYHILFIFIYLLFIYFVVGEIQAVKRKTMVN